MALDGLQKRLFSVCILITEFSIPPLEAAAIELMNNPTDSKSQNKLNKAQDILTGYLDDLEVNYFLK